MSGAERSAVPTRLPTARRNACRNYPGFTPWRSGQTNELTSLVSPRQKHLLLARRIGHGRRHGTPARPRRSFPLGCVKRSLGLPGPSVRSTDSRTEPPPRRFPVCWQPRSRLADHADAQLRLRSVRPRTCARRERPGRPSTWRSSTATVRWTSTSAPTRPISFVATSKPT